MNLLALETSTESLSLAVQRGQARWSWEGPGGGNSSKHLLRELLHLLQQAELSMHELQAVVVGQGPGSFTGLRTACSVAQGVAYPHGLPVLPVCSLMATAEQARRRYGCEQVLAVLDARMSEVYCAAYQWESGQWRCIKPAHTLAPGALEVQAPWQVVGNAFESYRPLWPDDTPHYAARPCALALLDLAPAMLGQGMALRAQEVLPVYIRDRVALNTAERLAGMTL